MDNEWIDSTWRHHFGNKENLQPSQFPTVNFLFNENDMREHVLEVSLYVVILNYIENAIINMYLAKKEKKENNSICTVEVSIHL